MKKLKEELTSKMHSEFTISKESSMWSVAGFDCDDVTMKRWCDAYGITLQQAMKYKDFWRKLSKK